jgi:hypothetical protein
MVIVAERVAKELAMQRLQRFVFLQGQQWIFSKKNLLHTTHGEIMQCKINKKPPVGLHALNFDAHSEPAQPALGSKGGSAHYGTFNNELLAWLVKINEL